jgi:hypothetical protein
VDGNKDGVEAILFSYDSFCSMAAAGRRSLLIHRVISDHYKHKIVINFASKLFIVPEIPFS